MTDEIFFRSAAAAAATTITNFPHPNQSKTIICDYFDDEEEDEQEDKSIPISYPSFQQGPICYSQQPRGQFDIPYDQYNDDPERASDFIVDLIPSLDVPIQRVSSEDELNFYTKRKRAKFVGPYLFGDVIGQGSYGKVKECLDSRNLCRRAVKIMQQRRLRKTPHGEQMAATEIRLLKKLNHPNVVRLYDFLRNDEKQKLYLFIDLCVVSLQEMLDSDERKGLKINAFPTWQAHGYFVQLINGLEYLHSKFIIHNDIKYVFNTA